MDEHQYHSLKHIAGLLDLSGRGKIEVAGKDRVEFLNNILTQDIKSLKPGQCAYSALLTATGKVIADMNVFVFEDNITLDTEPSVEKKLFQSLEKFLITEDVMLRDITSETMHLAIEGPKAAMFITNIGVPVFTMPRGMTGKIAFHILAARGEGEILKAELQKRGAELISAEVQETARIEAGWLRYGVDMDENVTLSETGLDDIAASETKGCYPGQEVVARTKTYKGLQRKMVRVRLTGNELPKTGEKILSAEGKEIERITSACFSPEDGKTIALGYASKGNF